MAAKWRVLRSAAGEIVLARVRLCESFWCHFRGLQLVSRLPEDEGLLFVNAGESTTHTTIHMLFMLFSIGVVWLDSSGKVVDKQLAKPWRLAYVPKVPAQYFIEANTSLLERVHMGDVLRFDEVVSS